MKAKLRDQYLPTLAPPKPKPKDSLFRRVRRGIWQARLWIGENLHRRTTGTRDKRKARQMLTLWRAQLERRGKPARVAVRADTEG